MRNKDYFRNKEVLIVGLARSGLACANLIHGLGAKVSLTDSRDNEATRNNSSKLISKEIKVELGAHSREFVRGKDLVVISPGVGNEALPVVWALESGIPVVSEIEIAWLLCPGRVIAVTGSNGKTTVTTLIGKILGAAGKKVFVCGNIGNPFSGEVDKIREGDFVSLEVSSFQLERINKFKPEISVMLNFTPNHLDRYRGMEEYLEAKKRIFMNQDESDFLVINKADPVLNNLAPRARAKVVYFSESEGLDPNKACVMSVGSLLGIGEGIIKTVFSGFKGIEHRQEFVARLNNIRFINDSKATTADSTMRALKDIDGRIVLIAGGRHKGIDYSVILGLAERKIKDVILIGEAKGKIRSAFRGALRTEEAVSLKEAVDKAFLKAGPGDTVLFSPMCSSFDMFSDYEERGRAFKEAVYDLAKEKGLK